MRKASGTFLYEKTTHLLRGLHFVFFADQFFHGHAQDAGDGLQLHVGGTAGLAFQLGEAGGVDVDAQKLHPGYQCGLFHAQPLADALHVRAADIFRSVSCFSRFQQIHPSFYFLIGIIKGGLLDLIPN